MGTVASIVVNFGKADVEGFIEAELDSKKNYGKTTFSPGEHIYFKVFADCNYKIESTAGSVSLVDENVVESCEAELITYIDTNVANTGKLVKKIDGYNWYGNDLGSVSIVGANSVGISSSDKRGVCKLAYSTEFDRWVLVPPSNMPTEFAIVIIIEATV